LPSPVIPKKLLQLMGIGTGQITGHVVRDGKIVYFNHLLTQVTSQAVL